MEEHLRLSKYLYISSLISGGVAGFVVDLALFPLDTLKTRLQSPTGFLPSGGFRGIYKGLGPTVAGSAPIAALFFITYEGFKNIATPVVSKSSLPLVHMTGASIGEIVACIVRVPVEIAKQRRQTSTYKNSMSSVAILVSAYRTEGIFNGLYRGFGSTVLREVPFSFIQFPLWEYFKTSLSAWKGDTLSPFDVAICGALAGGLAASITTPLDVAKTRIMLADVGLSTSLSVNRVLRYVYREKGIKGLFAGIVPRVIWITLGGAIFFGSYDFMWKLCDGHIDSRR